MTHTPDDTSIVLRSWNEDGAVVVAVDDDGPGVRDDDVEAVDGPGGKRLSELRRAREGTNRRTNRSSRIISSRSALEAER